MEQETTQGLGIIGFILTLIMWVVFGVCLALGYVIVRFLFFGDKPDMKGTKDRLLSIALWPMKKFKNKTDNSTTPTVTTQPNA